MKKSSLTVILVLVVLVAVSSFAVIQKNTASNSSDVTSKLSDDTSEVEESSILDSEESIISEFSASTSTSAEADETLKTFGKIGDNYILKSRRYLQGEVVEEDTVSLGWDGSLEICLNNAEVLDFSEDLVDDGTKKDQMVKMASYFENPKILRVSFSLKNIDAANKAGVQHQFDLSLFKLGSYIDLIPENYNDPENYIYSGNAYAGVDFIADPHGKGQDYYNFELNPGEIKDFTLTYIVDKEYLEQKDIFFGISANTRFNYGIMFDGLSEK